jgi:hypothetical protein
MSKTECQLYRHYDAQGVLLYVGISHSAALRASQHKKESCWYYQSATMTIENFNSREKAAEAEIAAIKNERPMFNIMGSYRDPIASPQLFVKKIERKCNAKALQDEIIQIELDRLENEEKLLMQKAKAEKKQKQILDEIASLENEILAVEEMRLKGLAFTRRHVLWQMYQKEEQKNINICSGKNNVRRGNFLFALIASLAKAFEVKSSA